MERAKYQRAKYQGQIPARPILARDRARQWLRDKESEVFQAENKEILLEYAAIDEDNEKSEQFVLKHTQLLREHATGFYSRHCINLQADGKTREMRKTARQYLLLTYVCDLAKSEGCRDASDAIRPLFEKMLTNQQTANAFEEHFEKYVEDVKTHAVVRKQEEAERAAEGEGDGERSVDALKDALQTGKQEEFRV